jgi:phage shock protein PspC (stress-responsive transcriptional regulator)
MADDQSTEQPPPQSEGPSIRRLYRSIHQKILGGVCGGIAEYINVDVVIVRVAWILFILMGGAGFLAYLICWLIIPAQTDPSMPAPPSRGSGGIILGLILIGLGVILSFSWLGWSFCW